MLTESNCALARPLLPLLVAASCSIGCARDGTKEQFSRAEFDATPLGSSPDDVRQRFGEPFMTAFEGRSSERLHWCYGNRADTGDNCLPPVLTFLGGKLQSRAWDAGALDAARAEEIAPGVTRAAFDAIPEGSSTDEARRALGAPLVAVTTVSAEVGNELHWCYGKRSSETGTAYTFPMLTFVDGRLRRRAWFGPPFGAR